MNIPEMLPMRRTTHFPLYLFSAFILALNLSVLSVEAIDPQDTSNERPPVQEDPSIILQATSERTFNFENIYQIELDLEIPGDIEVIAAEGEVISVTLEKQTQVINTEYDALIRAYLDNISLKGTQSDSTLRLDVQLPGGYTAETKPNRLADMPDLQAILDKQLQLKLTINTPADVGVNIRTKTGDTRLKRIRGKIKVTAETGNVQLDETLGSYNVTVKKGRIDGKILLTHGQNKLETHNGPIGLVILDTVATPMDVTAQGGSIRLELPENYAFDVELESEKQQLIVNLPTEIDEETLLTIVNGGGPLFRLKATDAISLLPSSPDAEDKSSDLASDPFAGLTQPVPETAQPPVIDGNLSEISWQMSGVLSPFQNAGGTDAAQNPTETFLLWDSENVYIGVKAYVPESQIPHISQTQHDSPIWEDECVEILIDPNLQTDIYYHLVINPIGAFFDQQVNVPGAPYFRLAPQDVQLTLDQKTMGTTFDADSDWHSDASVATQINTTFWSIEVALPRKMLEKPAALNTKEGGRF